MVQVNRMLKPEKWLAAFDSDGKALGFQKTLKSIVLGVCCLTMKRCRDSILKKLFLRFSPFSYSHECNSNLLEFLNQNLRCLILQLQPRDP